LTESPEAGYTVFRLPRSHWHCTLYSFQWDKVRPASLHTAVTSFLHELQDGKVPHMLLTGSAGVGKTHIGVGVYRVASTVFGTQQVTWLNVPAFCEQIKQSYRDGDEGAWADVEEARKLVVLDDLFGRTLTSHEAEQIVYRIIDTAYRNNAAVLATMNQSHEELKDRLPGHEVSRLLANVKVFPMKADKDWRL